MAAIGLDWKKSICEARRILELGGRFLFVESVNVGSGSYLGYLMGLSDFSMENKGEDGE